MRSLRPKLTGVTKSRTFLCRRHDSRERTRRARRRGESRQEAKNGHGATVHKSRARGALRPRRRPDSRPLAPLDRTRAKALFRDVDSAYREFHQIYHAWVGTIFEFLFERHGIRRNSRRSAFSGGRSEPF